MHGLEIGELARVSAVVDNASNDGEEQAGDDAVGEHLQNCAGEADLIERHEAEEHEAHMADRRVADDELEVGLRESDERAVDDSNDCEHGEDFTPGMETEDGESPGIETVRIESDGNAQATIGTELHDNTGEQHGG